MYAHLVLLAGVLVHKGRTIHRIFSLFGRQGNRPMHGCACSHRGIHNRARGLIYNLVIIGTNTDTDTLMCVLFLFFLGSRWMRVGHVSIKSIFLITDYFMILVTTPAPTVLPPSRIANRCFYSRATGAISLILRFTVSHGMTISTPAGKSVTSPVTSVVRI